jgi:pseudouridine-5'-phosphate glycosidase
VTDRVSPSAASFGASPSAALRERLAVAPEVADALASRVPVVALESTLISHGLPYPRNLEVAIASEEAVRRDGAVPATIAIRDGRVLVGLDGASLRELATTEGVRKAARPTLAAALAAGGWAATTVSSTMLAAHAAGIRVLATGGIGGVHRGAFGGRRGGSGPGDVPVTDDPTLDVSSDLEELARTPVAVVCAGPKAILDVPLTLEYLETRGVPVLAVGTDEVPGFYSRGSGIPAPESVPRIAEAARVVAAHLGLGLGSGILVCVPVPEADALPLEDARRAIGRATREADELGVAGPAVTPWLLARVAELTDGASIRANTALIVNDAAAGAALAREILRLMA